jgi:hypothetical protein
VEDSGEEEDTEDQADRGGGLTMNLVSRSRPCSSDAAKDTTPVQYRVHSLLYGKPFVALHCKHFGHPARIEALTRRFESSAPDSDTDMDEISLGQDSAGEGRTKFRRRG